MIAQLFVRHLLVIVSFLLLYFSDAVGQIERFIPAQGGTTEVWRITQDPAMRDWIQYHNKKCWSPDGRYIGYQHYRAYGDRSDGEVRVYDLHRDTAITIDRGAQTRMANTHNWVLYLRRNPNAEPGRESEVWQYDIDSGRKTRIGWGVSSLGETDYADRWIYGM